MNLFQVISTSTERKSQREKEKELIRAVMKMGGYRQEVLGCAVTLKIKIDA